MNNIYSALVIGEYKIRIIFTKIIDDNIFVIGNEEVHSEGIEHFKIIDEPKFNKSLLTLLKKIKSKYDFEFAITLIMPASELNVYKKSATISFSGQYKNISENDILAVTRNCALSNLNSELEVIEIIPLYYGISDGTNFLYPPLNIQSTNLSLTCYAITMPKSIAHSYVQSLEKSGFIVNDVISGPSASSHYFNSIINENNYLMVDIAFNSTKISLIVDRKVAAINILDIGSNSITLALAEKLKISTSIAEELKIKFANPYALSEDLVYKSSEVVISEFQLNSIVNQSLDILLKEINLVITSLVAEKSLPIFLLGGGTELKNIKEKMQSYINLSISTIRPSIIGVRKYQYIPLIGACLATYEKEQPIQNVPIEVKNKHSDNFETAGHFLDILKGNK